VVRDRSLKTAVRIRAPHHLADQVAKQVPHLHCRDAQVGLEEQALDLAAGSGVLLGLDLVERELESAGGCQPGLQQRERNQAGVASAQKELAVVIFRRNITERTMSRIFVSQNRSRQVPQNAALERHMQRFLELRRHLDTVSANVQC
jgi:hypothetical protein